MTHKNVKFRLIAALAATAIFAIATPALAAEFMAPNQYNQGVISLSSSQPAKNLYIVGSTLNLGQETGGDLVAAGGTINLDNAVEKDTIIAGATINIGGVIGDDLRAAGGTINVRKAVLGDAILGGGTVTLDKEANVGGDLVAAGGTINVNSKVTGKTSLSGGTVVFGGEATGDMVVKAKKLTILSTAKIGNLKYYGPGQPEIQSGAVVGHVEVTKVEYNTKAVSRSFNAGGFIFKLIVLVLTGLVFIWLLKGRASEINKQLWAKPWANLGIGFLALISAPILSFILVIIFGLGLYVAIFIMALYVAVLLFAFLEAMVIAGGWVTQKLTKRSSLLLDWQAVIIGAAVMCLVGIIPYVGGLAVFIWFLIALGSTVKDLFNQEKHRNQNIQN